MNYFKYVILVWVSAAPKIPAVSLNPTEQVKAQISAAIGTENNAPQKLDDLFKALNSRSIYGPGFVDPIFSEKILDRAYQLKAAAKEEFTIVIGDFVNARGARKFIQAVLGRDDPGMPYVVKRRIGNDKLNTLMAQQAQYMKQELEQFCQDEAIDLRNLYFLSVPGDQAVVLIRHSSHENTEKIQTKVTAINQGLRDLAVSWGFDKNAHLKDKPQAGFGLVSAAGMIDESFEKDSDKLDLVVAPDKRKLYSLGADEKPKTSREDILLEQIPDEIQSELLTSFKAIPLQGNPQREVLKATRSFLEALGKPIESVVKAIDGLLKTKCPLTDTLAFYNLEEEFEELKSNCKASNFECKPAIASLIGSSIAGLNAVSLELGIGFVKYFAKMIREELEETGYSEAMITKMFFNPSSSFMWLLLPPYKDLEMQDQLSTDEMQNLKQRLDDGLKTKLKELEKLSLGELAELFNRDLACDIKLDGDNANIKLAELANPKIYFDGAEPFTRKGLMPRMQILDIDDLDQDLTFWQDKLNTVSEGKKQRQPN